MSDSDDDNVYSDYLTNRRVTVQRNRQAVATYESDSDDDLAFLGKGSAPKRKREDDILADSDEEESFVTKVVETHNQKFKNKMDDLEEEYRKNVFNDNDGMIRVSTMDRNDALSNVIKTVQTLNRQTKTSTSAAGEEEEVEQEKDEEVVVADVSTGSFPVSLIIMDYECKGGDIRNRRELPLNSTFYEVRKEYAQKWNCRVDLVNLTYNGVKIEDQTTPKDLGFRPLEVPERIDANKLGGADGVFEKSPSPTTEVMNVDNETDYITLKVQLKNRRKPVHIKATDDTTIHDLKERIIQALTAQGENKIPTTDKMKVMFDDEYLTDMNQTCKEIGLEDADCVDIFF
ncbi:hypothetical protein CAEBREN_29106 [Caenorhabditis brenneri]|uniref:Ubiquitin-like domain-containing protein n=1 Tax=Caenorhabditis brenneri TaxID=135651 RepID=G0MED5_CAEBE|nr:hypothetical protein CAEBREN_29106 [Caenorhabditis brenneri]